MLKKYARFFYNGFLKKAPLQVTLFVTSRCNYRCKMCFYWESVQNKSIDELTIEEIEKISKNIPKFFWLSIGGGEPFLRDDLPQIAKLFYDNAGIRHLSIPTNASLPEKTLNILEEILEACPDMFVNVNLSLNALNDQHDEICGKKGAFEKVLETYRLLADLKKRRLNFGLGINITHSKYSQPHLIELIDYTINTLTGIDNISLALVRGIPKQAEAMDIDIEMFKRAVERIESYVVQGRVRTFKTLFGKLIFAKDIIMRRLLASILVEGWKTPCYAGRLTIVIDEKANVYFCELLPQVGNLREVNFQYDRIEMSEKYQTALKKVRDYCFCTYECAYSINILLNPRFWPRLFLEYLKLTFKKVIKAESYYPFEKMKFPRKSK